MARLPHRDRVLVAAALALALWPRVVRAQQGAVERPAGGTRSGPAVVVDDEHLPPPPPAEGRAPRGLDAFYQNGRFLLHDRARDLWLSPGGLAQLDGVLYAGDGILDGVVLASGAYRRPDVENTLLVRRARLEVMAGAFERYTAEVSAEFGTPVPVTNGDPLPWGQGAQLQTAWFNARFAPMFQLMVGQLNVPLSLENRTDIARLDTPERSLLVRSLLVPGERELGAMAWGETPSRSLEYYVGGFLGDGPGRLNRDVNWDGIARVATRPFLESNTILANLHLGVSARYGVRGVGVDYGYPSMVTPGGFLFFRPAYARAGTGPATVVPDGEQLALAGEIDWPFQRFNLRAEAAYVANGTREMAATPATPAALSGSAVRLGRLSGWGFYAQFAYWVQGAVAVNGRAGTGYRPVIVDPIRHPDLPLPQGLQLLLRVEAVDFVYDAEGRGTTGGPGEVTDRAGRYTVWGLAAALNYWAGSYVRLTAHYEQYFVGVLPPNGTLGFYDNHALGPRNARGPVGTFGELTLRAALGF